MDFRTETKTQEVALSNDKLQGILFGAAAGETLATASGSHSPGRWGHATAIVLAATEAFVEAAQESYSIEDALEGKERAEYVERLAADWDTLVILERKIRLGKRRTPCWAAELPLRVAPAAPFLFRSPIDATGLPSLLAAIASATNPHPFAVIPAIELCIVLLAILKEEEMPSFSEIVYPSLPGLDEGLGSCLEDYQRLIFWTATDELDEASGVRMRKTVMDALDITPGAKWSSPPDFKAAVLKAAIRSSDRGTAGALTGMMLGAHYGVEGIPKSLLSGLGGKLPVYYVSDTLCDWFLLDEAFGGDNGLPEEGSAGGDRNPTNEDAAAGSSDSHSGPATHIIYDVEGESLFFLEKKYALDLLHVKKVVHSCAETGITWGEFRDRHPRVFEEVYENLIDMGLLTLEAWFDEYWEGYELSLKDLSESKLEKAKLAYRNHAENWEFARLPLLDELFEVCGGYIDFFDDWFRGNLRLSYCLPDDILHEYGELHDPPMGHMCTVIAPEHEKTIVDELEARGYVVERDGNLVSDVFYS